MRTSKLSKDLPRLALLALLTGLILCPLITVFAKAVIIDGRLDLYQAWRTIAGAENVQTICNSLLLGVCVVLCSTVIAVPTAFLLARTELKKHSWLDIIFMIPFMTPPYIASMGWILFMQKKGLFQQLFPATGSWSEGFFCFGGLVLVMSLHVFPFLMTMLKNAMQNCEVSFTPDCQPRLPVSCSGALTLQVLQARFRRWTSTAAQHRWPASARSCNGTQSRTVGSSKS